MNEKILYLVNKFIEDCANSPYHHSYLAIPFIENHYVILCDVFPESEKGFTMIFLHGVRGYSYEKIGVQYNISGSRVGQIINQTAKKFYGQARNFARRYDSYRFNTILATISDNLKQQFADHKITSFDELEEFLLQGGTFKHYSPDRIIEIFDLDISLSDRSVSLFLDQIDFLLNEVVVIASEEEIEVVESIHTKLLAAKLK